MNLTDHEIKIITLLAENDMRVINAAKKMFWHRNTIDYHIAKIHKKTGLNPKNFYDLIKLIEIVKEIKDEKNEQGA